MSSVYPSKRDLQQLPSMRNLSMYPTMIDCDDVQNYDFNRKSDKTGLELEMDCLFHIPDYDDEREYHRNQEERYRNQDIPETIFFERKADENDRMKIEIAPGVTTHYRFATETLDAYKLGNTVLHKCICCGTKLHIVNDAEFVFCPVDNVIQPIEAVVTPKKRSIAPAPRRGIFRETGFHHFHPKLLERDFSQRNNHATDMSSLRNSFMKSFSSFRYQKPKIGGIGLGILDLEL